MGNEAAFTIYGSARATGASASLSPAGHVPVDYKTETQDALKKLQEQIEAVRVADVHKRMLTRVRADQDLGLSVVVLLMCCCSVAVDSDSVCQWSQPCTRGC
jgi:hypothetical protein